MTDASAQVQAVLEFLQGKRFITYKQHPTLAQWRINIDIASMFEKAPVENFNIDVLLMNDSISFSSILFRNISGTKARQFYELLLRYSSYLNELKFAVTPDGRYVTIQAEADLSGLNQDLFFRLFTRFIKFYNYTYPVLIDTLEALDLGIKRKGDKLIDSHLDRMIDSTMMDSTSDIGFLPRQERGNGVMQIPPKQNP